MKQFILALVCLCAVITTKIYAQSEQQFTGSLLWKVSGKDITSPSYILGTHHLVNVSFLKEIAGYDETFNNCNTIIGEIDLRNKAALQELVQQSILLDSKDKSYREVLSEKEYIELDKNLQSYLGMPLSTLSGYKPMMISTLLAVRFYADALPTYNPLTHEGIDEYIQIEGLEKGKKIKGLETVKDQIDALFSDPFEDQLAELLCTFDEIDDTKATTIKLNEFYKAAQLGSLYNLAFDTSNENTQSACPITTDKKHIILDNRNEKWLEKLPQLLKEDSNLIVVGALHLPGEEGLLTQLHKMGYKIEAVK